MPLQSDEIAWQYILYVMRTGSQHDGDETTAAEHVWQDGDPAAHADTTTPRLRPQRRLPRHQAPRQRVHQPQGTPGNFTSHREVVGIA